jgi:hypothetical protein
VIVRAKIEVDPLSAALTVTTDPIPHILDGIPLQIKHVNVTIDRQNFTFNPTNCSALKLTGTIASTEGASAAVESPFQVTNCAALKFAPKFAVSTSGKTSKANGASLAVKLSYPSAPFGTYANIAKAKVSLPKQLPSRLTTIQKACTAAVFAQSPANCPAGSVLGHAKVITPLVPVPLEGPAYFVSHGGEAFPAWQPVRCRSEIFRAACRAIALTSEPRRFQKLRRTPRGHPPEDPTFGSRLGLGRGFFRSSSVTELRR